MSNAISVFPNEYISPPISAGREPWSCNLFSSRDADVCVPLEGGEDQGWGKEEGGILSAPVSAQHQIRLQEALKV